MRSVTKNGRSIFLTAVLAIILVYLFSIVGFLFFKDDFLMEVDHHPALSKSEVPCSTCCLKNMWFRSCVSYFHIVLRDELIMCQLGAGHTLGIMCVNVIVIQWFQMCDLYCGHTLSCIRMCYRCNRRIQCLCRCAFACKHTCPCGCVELGEDLLAHGTCCITQQWPHSLM